MASVLPKAGLPGLPVTGEAGQRIGFASRNHILRAVADEPPLDLCSGVAPPQR